MEQELTKKEISKRIAKVFSKVEIRECEMCGAFISSEEYKQFEKVCKKHWDY